MYCDNNNNNNNNNNSNNQNNNNNEIQNKKETFKLSAPPESKMLDIIKGLQTAILEINQFDYYPVQSEELENSLVKFEKNMCVSTYKFGVLYCAPDQTEENEMFSNRTPFSPLYTIIIIIIIIKEYYHYYYYYYYYLYYSFYFYLLYYLN